MENTNQPQPSPPAKSDQSFYHVVGILLLVIIAALVGLLLGLQRRYVQTELRLQQAQNQLQRNQEAMQVLTQNADLFAALERDKLPVRPATLDGQSVKVLQLDARQAARVGLEPGDILRVEPSPESSPATQRTKTNP